MEWTRTDHIDADPRRVWDLTIDVERWPEIHFFATREH